MARDTDPTSLTSRIKGAPSQARELLDKGKAAVIPPQADEHEPIYAMMRADVIDSSDPEGLGRVMVELPESLGLGERAAWCHVVAAGAGDHRGIWFRPEAGDEVVIAFEEGDPGRPIVIGGLWRQAGDTPVNTAHADDRRGLYSREGRSIEFDDDNVSITIRTPSGIQIVLNDDDRECRVTDSSGGSVLMDDSGITIESSTNIRIAAAATLELSAALVRVDAALAEFSGMVKTPTMQADSVIASTYTPGAGNVY